MKKIKNLFFKNIKSVVAFIIGVIISGGVVYAATLFTATQVTYNNSNSGSQSTTVEGALDELYTMANNIVPIDPDTFMTNSTKTVYASSKGVCIKRKNKLHCLKINNWNEEKDHIKQIFSDTNCIDYSSEVQCNGASDFNCSVINGGPVRCDDRSSLMSCTVYPNRSITCY
jgi:hypothetical protein